MDIYSKSDFDILFVTDLNLTKDQLDKLGSMKKPLNKIIYIDHHQYDYDVSEYLKEKNIISVYDNKFSGCMNTYLYLSKYKDISHLLSLNEIADRYDLWKKEDPLFMLESMPLNDLFWGYGINKFYQKFKKGYKLDDEDKQTINQIKKEREEYLETTYRDFSTTFTRSNTLVTYNPSNKFTNEFTLYFPDFSIYLILREIVDNKVHFSLRINSNNDLTIQDFFSTLQKKYKHYILCGGHTKSGGITIEESKFEEFMTLFEEVCEEVNYVG